MIWFCPMISKDLQTNPFWIHYSDSKGGHILLDRHGMPIQFSWQDIETGKIEQVLSLVSDNLIAYAPLSREEVDWAIKNNENNYFDIIAAN